MTVPFIKKEKHEVIEYFSRWKGTFTGNVKKYADINFHPRDFLKIPGIRDFLSLGISYPRDFLKISGIYAKSAGFLSPGFGIFDL